MGKINKVIVITAGGTIEHIDSVRTIRNSSSGKLGSLMAESIKNSWDDVEIIYISNRYAIRPNIQHEWIETTSVLDVEQKVKELLETRKVDIFIHSMAVADYYVEGIETEQGEFVKTETLLHNKLSSDGEEIKVILKKAPKIISQIKKWQPLVYLVGFKLLNETTEENLFNVGFNLLRKNRCNLVIANDLASIKKGNHEGLFIVPEKKYDKIKGKETIAEYLTSLLLNRAFCKHSNSKRLSENSNVPGEVLSQMKNIGKKLFDKGLLPIVEGGTYGNLSVKDDNGFYITGRNVDKGNLTGDILCKIEDCKGVTKESVYAEVFYHGKVKPSIDSAIHHAIYSKIPSAEAILHVHTDDFFDKPLSSYNYPCGTMEERDSIVELMDKENTVIQMKKHGVIIAGLTLNECLSKLDELYSELRLTPFVSGDNEELWNEWLVHLQEVGNTETLESSLLNKENYYLILEKGLVYGLCYISIDKTKDLLNFAIFTSEQFQKSGKGIGKRALKILEQIEKSENLTLELITKPLCSVTDYYKKQGFSIISEDDGLIRMRKNSISNYL